ncbi:MAG: pyridoxal phosphate-dependent aminotransferase [Mangrovibacterium sp.]
MIYGHGDDTYQGEVQLNFSSNVNPYGPSFELKAHLHHCLSNIHNYPEPLATPLANALAQKHELQTNSVLVTNGATEAIYLLAEVFKRKRSLILTPSFSEYEDACRCYNHELMFAHHNAPWQPVNTDVVWLCNPNNPDGKIYSKEKLQQLLVQHKHCTFIIDEAYTDFLHNDISLINEVKTYENLIIIRSLTKRFAIPALRLGYLVCSPKLLKSLQAKLHPWRINELALQAGLYCLAHNDSWQEQRATLLTESERFQQEIQTLNGFELTPSDTTFFLVKSPIPAALLKKKLLERYQILIRNASNFRSLSDFHLRLATQTPEANDDLLNILRSWNY